MQEQIRKNNLRVIRKAIIVLEHHDFTKLANISDETTHDAVIFDDKDSLNLAVMLYALSKILIAKKELAHQFHLLLEQAHNALAANDTQGYQSLVQEIFGHISQINKHMNNYVIHVIEQSKIKKGSRLYQHGISIGESADRLGISQWELYNYIGKTKEHDSETTPKDALSKRLAYAKQILTKTTDNKIIFDAGPIISLTMNNLLHVLPKLKHITETEFLIPQAVKNELVDKPLHTHKHKLEAFQVMKYIHDGTLTIVDQKHVYEKAKEIEEIANTIFFAHGTAVDIIHAGELEVLALALLSGIETIVVDERTTRYLIESPVKIIERLESKLHTHIHVDIKQLYSLHRELKSLRTIRSSELLYVAFTHGLLDEDMNVLEDEHENRKDYLAGILWGLKLNGCGISVNEIEQLLE